MNQNPLLSAIFKPDFDQLIDDPPPQFRIAHDVLKFRVERLITSAPIDLAVGLSEKQSKKWFKTGVGSLREGG